jgi:BMFP domain-containing protein YqiC
MPMQNDNPFLDGLARLFTDAAGAAQGAKAEFESFLKQRLEKLIADMDLVRRDEFEAVKAMAAKAREENESLARRLEELERRSTP